MTRALLRGTKRLMAKYGEDLVCVRYRYDEEAGERLKTVEVVVGRVRWEAKTPRAEEEVRVRLDEGEDLLRRSLLLNGAKWDERTDSWRLTRSVAESPGLRKRILRREPRGKRSRPGHERRDLPVDRTIQR